MLGQQTIKAQREQQMAEKELAQQAQVVEPERPAGSTVGQPGVSRTKVTTGSSVGGYGSTGPGQINPTGLNI